MFTHNTPHMEKGQYAIFINAPKETVWKTMMEQETYRMWTVPFHEGSYYEGDWTIAGSTVRFLGPSEDGTGEGGMLSRVKEVRPNEYISFEHYGMIIDGAEDTSSEEVKQWTPAFESYALTETDGGTTFAVQLDMPAEFIDMFETMWPKALEILKQLSEDAV